MEERMRELEKRVEALEAQLTCKSKRKKYNQDYYQKKKKEKKKEERALRHMNPRLNTIFSVSPGACRTAWKTRPDLPYPLEVWTQKLKDFVAQGRRVDQYLEWLAWSWNHDTWMYQPVTKTSGRWHYFVSKSGTKAQRQAFTDRDFTGHVKAHQTRFTKLHQDVIQSALWWRYADLTFKMIIVNSFDSEWFDALPTDYKKVLLVASSEEYELEGKSFHYCLDVEEGLGKMYTLALPTLQRAWRATFNGFKAKKEPFV